MSALFKSLKSLFSKVDPQIEYLRARDALAIKKYTEAIQRFQKAASYAGNEDFRARCFFDAAIAATHVDKEQAITLFYSSSKLYAKKKESESKALEALERAWNLLLTEENLNPAFEEIPVILMLFYLSQGRISLAKKIYEHVTHLDTPITKKVEHIWNSVQQRGIEERNYQELYKLNLPREFRNIERKAQFFIRAYQQIDIEWMDMPKELELGQALDIKAKITNYAPVEITNLDLKASKQGISIRRLKTPLPIKMSENVPSSVIITYEIYPQISGTWTIGPLSATYSIVSEDDHLKEQKFTIESSEIEIFVKEPPHVLDTVIEAINLSDEEDKIVIYLKNVGKNVIKRLKINVHPQNSGNLTVVDGVTERQFVDFPPNDETKYSLTVKKKHAPTTVTLTIDIYIDEQLVESSSLQI